VIEKDGEKDRKILSAMFSPTNTVLGHEKTSLMGRGLLLEHMKYITDVDVGQNRLTMARNTVTLCYTNVYVKICLNHSLIIFWESVQSCRMILTSL